MKTVYPLQTKFAGGIKSGYNNHPQTCALVFRLFYKQIFPRHAMVHTHIELFYLAQAEMSSQTKEGANLIKELRNFFKD